MEDLNKTTSRPKRTNEVSFSTLVDMDSGREVASLWREDLIDLIIGRENHDKLIQACSGLVTEEDGSDLVANHYRVGYAVKRVLDEKAAMATALKNLCKARWLLSHAPKQRQQR